MKKLHKITAGSLCGDVVRQIEIAQIELDYFSGRILNGWGEFGDRSRAGSALARARRALEDAQKAYDEARRQPWRQDDPDAE